MYGQYTILTRFLSCWLINLGIFFTRKKVITNFLNSLNVYRKIRPTQKFCSFEKTAILMHVGKIEETSGEITLENDCYKICSA